VEEGLLAAQVLLAQQVRPQEPGWESSAMRK